MATGKAKYRVMVGMNYPPNEIRAEAGDIVDDLPPKSIRSLREQGFIVQVDAKGVLVDVDLSIDDTDALMVDADSVLAEEEK